jgi:replicative superfamily II helicase
MMDIIEKADANFQFQIDVCNQIVYKGKQGCKSKAQHAGIIFACLPQTKNLWLIAPTASGKSGVFLVSTIWRKKYVQTRLNYCTILVVPLKSVARENLDRARLLGITMRKVSAIIRDYESKCNLHPPDIILVTYEELHEQLDRIMTMLKDYQSRNYLSKLVIDDAQVICKPMIDFYVFAFDGY